MAIIDSVITVLYLNLTIDKGYWFQNILPVYRGCRYNECRYNEGVGITNAGITNAGITWTQCMKISLMPLTLCMLWADLFAIDCLRKQFKSQIRSHLSGA